MFTIPCIELTDDPSFGDGEGLLLHDFMQDGAGGIAHLVKLVDTADAVIGQDQSSGLQNKLSSLRILGDVSSQTDGRGALTRRVLRPWHKIKDVLEQLGFGCTGVTAQQDVDL